MRKSLPFYKMQGCGNDYVYVNTFEHTIEDAASLARRVSNRHFGVGSDGLILLAPPEAGGDAQMIMFNADGSQSEMCGNGIRCVAKLAYDLGICRKNQLAIETAGGTKSIELVFEGSVVTGARVSMGVPNFDKSAVPMPGEGSAIDHVISVEGKNWTGTGVNLGNPHFVIFPDSKIDDSMVHGLGSKLERHSDFPQKANIEFIEVISRSAIRMRVWERGSGETMACGTGASAALAAAVVTKRTERSVICQLKGGDLELSWPNDQSELFMTGPAVLVFEGQLYDF
ncbi:MAG: diaminopimelate epimerase [Planctomycetota bacterium]|nr:diaminopimelate epimerase [Planctomycetota bacterium]